VQDLAVDCQPMCENSFISGHSMSDTIYENIIGEQKNAKV